MNGHYIKTCKYCKIVISQCRCGVLSDKKKILGLCDNCKSKGFKEDSEFEFVSEVPKEAGDLVSSCVYKDHLIVACQYGIFRLEGDVLVQIKFKL